MRVLKNRCVSTSLDVTRVFQLSNRVLQLRSGQAKDEIDRAKEKRLDCARRDN